MVKHAGKLMVVTVAALASTAATPPARPPAASGAAGLLLPVSDADAAHDTSMGCESWFTQGRTGFTFMRETVFMLRTAPGRAGLHICPVSDDQAAGFRDEGKQLACGGRRVSVRRIGRVSSNAEADSSDFPAQLTVTDGKRSATLRGRFGTAC